VVLVFGTICIDSIRRISSLPKKGGYCAVEDQTELLGGEAANTACYLTMWRQEVALAGNALGSGFDGEALRMKLLEKGLDVHLLQKAGTTPVCDVYVTADGDRTMFGYGFHHEASHTPFDALPFQAGHWFTADPNIPNASRLAAKMAHTNKMKLYLMDFSRDNEIIPKGAYCQYGTDSVGERGNQDLNLKWVAEWTEKHNCTTILTDGGLGLYVAELGGEPKYFPAFPPIAIVDTTGAGDAFRAGTIYGLIHKKTLYHSVRFGAAAASLKVAHLGATENVPSLREVESWIKAHPEIAQAYDI
jgi:sugar/nucleoside kinase (ribokinase family)